MKEEYVYNVTIVKIVDGDTFVADVDLGFSIFSRQVFRIYGINTPEVIGKSKSEGLKSKVYVQNKLPVGLKTTIKTYKDKKEKYGRYLAEIYYLDHDVYHNLGQELVNMKLAVKYML